MKVESLLSEVEVLDEEEAGTSPEALDNRCRMLERLASEVSRLTFYAAKGTVCLSQFLPSNSTLFLRCMSIRLCSSMKVYL